MSLEDKIKNAKETSWPLLTPKKETITYLDGFADGLNMANNSTNKMLDKIREEIDLKYGHCVICEYSSDYCGSSYEPIGDITDVLQIISKHKTETEADNGDNT